MYDKQVKLSIIIILNNWKYLCISGANEENVLKKSIKIEPNILSLDSSVIYLF